MEILMPITTLISLCLFFLAYPALLSVHSQHLPPINRQDGNITQVQTYIVHVHKPKGAKFLRFGDRKKWYMSFLPNATLSSEEQRMIYTYHQVISGFAARLTHEELEAMKAMEGFVATYPDRILEGLTTYTPELLGLKGGLGQGFWSKYNSGEGTIIGVIDSGITPTHPSFKDEGMPPAPTKWKGSCYWGGGSICNNKLIGAIGFKDGFIHNPLDDSGHGTHVASIAAGAPVDDAEVLGYAKGRASGTAPGAHLAVYKVIHNDGKGGSTSKSSDTLKAIDQAIHDNVDVLSMSLGKDNIPLYESSVVIGSFAAMERGIFPCAAAGNNGSAKSIIANDAPWIMTVGASTPGRKIMAAVKLGNGDEFPGQSTYQPSALNNTQLPLVFPFDILKTADALACNVDLRQFNVQGKIVLCAYVNVEDDIRGRNVQAAGGAGMIVMNSWGLGDLTIPHSHVIPATNVGSRVGKEIVTYYRNTTNPTAAISFQGTKVGVRPYPAVMLLSSRGPSLMNGGIIKPDVIAPGVNVVGAWPWDISPTPSGKASTFNFESGTSMATPHVSGIAALLKMARPNWSPSEIKSALMTTASAMDRDGNRIIDQYVDGSNSSASVHAMGSGHINPLAAVDPGLVYNLDYYNYVHYLCGAGFLDSQIGSIIRGSVQCANVRAVPPEDLNYPSFIASLGYSNKSVTVRRTVTNVGDPSSLYTVGVDEPPRVSVHVNPTTLQFSQVGEKLSFEVSFTLKGAPLSPGEVSEGELYWDSGKYRVRSPIAVTFI